MTHNISVVLTAFNAEATIKDAIESVLHQSFQNFEFIIINDGSTDHTLDIINTYSDKRIKVLNNQHRYIESLNLGLHFATGKYIARIDADDYMHPDRLHIQYHFLENNPDIHVCGSWMQTFGRVNNNIITNGHGLIKQPIIKFLNCNIINHPTVMIRRDFFSQNNLFYKDYPLIEDYKLWSDAALKKAKFYIIPYPLLFFRVSANQISNQKRILMEKNSDLIRLEIINHIISIQDNTEIKNIFINLRELFVKGFISKEIISEFIQLLYNSKKTKEIFYS